MRQAVAIALSLFPTAVLAGNLCTFTTECFENEASQETAFTMEYRAGLGGANEFELVTDAETIAVSVGGSGDVAYLAGMTESGFHVLTVTRETGAARYTNHVASGPFTVSYLGSCEVSK